MPDKYSWTFGEAWEMCQADGAWPAMIKTEDDLQDIRNYTTVHSG